MRMRKGAGRAMFSVAAAALAFGFGATAALAATTLTVKVTNGGTYRATARPVLLRDGGVNITCSGTSARKASTAAGSIPTGMTTGASPVKIGTVATLRFRDCAGPRGAAVTITASNLPYSAKVDSKTNTAGQTDAVISGISASVSMKGCSFTVAGSAPGFYANNTHKLALQTMLPVTPLNKARLTISGVTGCAGMVRNGDHPTIKASYTVSRAIKISSK